MKAPKHASDSWRDALKLINRCPICSESYDVDRAKLLARQAAATFVHITCSKCASYFVAMILQVGQGLSSVGVVTDLSFDDVRRLYKKPVLTTDDIIKGFQMIEQKNFIHSLFLKG